MTEISTLLTAWRNAPVGTIMTHPVQVVVEQADLAVVEQTFLEHRIRHLPVVDEEGRIVGVVSQRDVYRTVSPIHDDQGPSALTQGPLVEDGEFYYDKQRLHDFELSKVMRERPQVLYPEDTLGTALEIFVNRKIGCLPIINPRREVVGILTRHDLLKFFHTALTAPSHPEN